jgi:hypothetical protein
MNKLKKKKENTTMTQADSDECDKIVIFGNSYAERVMPLLRPEPPLGVREERRVAVDVELLRTCGFNHIANLLDTNQESLHLEWGSVKLLCRSPTVAEAVLEQRELFAEFIEKHVLKSRTVMGIRFSTSSTRALWANDWQTVNLFDRFGFITVDVKCDLFDNPRVGRNVGRALTSALRACVSEASRDQFFSLCSTHALPFIVQLVQTKFRKDTVAFFELLVAQKVGEKSRLPLDKLPDAAQVRAYAMRKGEELPKIVTTYTLRAGKSGGMLVVHARAARLRAQLAPALAQFAKYGPLDDIPFVEMSQNSMPITAFRVIPSSGDPLLVSLEALDLGAPDVVAVARTEIAKTSVRCVSLMASRNLSAELLQWMLERRHVELICVAECGGDRPTVNACLSCFESHKALCERKLLDSRLGRESDEALLRSLSEPSKQRRWSAMMDLHGASYLVPELQQLAWEKRNRKRRVELGVDEISEHDGSES